MTRAGRSDDLVAVLALEHEAFGDDAWSARLVEDALPHLLVADDRDGQGAGYAVLTVAGDVADLQRIAVRAPQRRTGLARRLLDAALARAAQEGAERVLVEVRADNDAALAFYVAVGFTEIDRRRRYYRDGAEALVLQLDVPRDLGDWARG